MTSPGEADIYANARIRGQSYTSTIINGEDSFTFPGSYAPFTWIRSVPASEPGQYAGHVDDRPGRDRGPELGRHRRRRLPAGRTAERFSLDKGLYDDFERGDNDTYSVPIGSATREGFTVGDIDRVAIEKSKDGLAGGWFLHGVTLIVNGQMLVRDRSIDRWLEDSRRIWNANGPDPGPPDLRCGPRLAAAARGRLRPTGHGGHQRIRPRTPRCRSPTGWGPNAASRVTGDDRLKGRRSLENGDRARVGYRLSTYSVRPPP